jgi:UDP-N-acetylmuramate dehydrogenase
MNLLQQELIAKLGRERISVAEPLARHCNWKVGGPADLFVEVRTIEELIEVVLLARRQKQPTTILGYGANVLISDRGVRGLVILNRADRLVFHADCVVEADSGTNLALLAKRAAERGITGLEFLMGIPGTVGAAVAGNVGTRTRWMSHVLERVRILGNDDRVQEVPTAELAFSYRNSRLKHTGEVVLTAWLQGQVDEPANIERRMNELLQLRKNQPAGPSTGSVFKNPPGDFAGRLIETCGLKGYQIGGAKISEIHANFILNVGGATASDIKALIEKAKTEVAQRSGVQLEKEIQNLGEW